MSVGRSAFNVVAEAARPRAHAPRYGSVLVHAGHTAEADGLVRAAADIANLFGAKLIGISSAPGLPGHPPSEAEEEATQLLLEDAALRFQGLTQGVRAGAAWRPSRGAPAEALRRYAWAADLIVAGVRPPSEDAPRGATLRDLVVGSGRPVLVRPHGVARAPVRRVAVLWDGSPSGARALAGALPFLAKAERVTLVADGRADARATEALDTVREGLSLRGIVTDVAADWEADLLVMAGWPRSRALAFTDPTERRVAALTSLALISH